MSKKHNTSGYYRVSKNTYPNGKITWRYIYYEDGKRHSISDPDIKKLQKKVESKGLDWIVLRDDDA